MGHIFKSKIIVHSVRFDYQIFKTQALKMKFSTKDFFSECDQIRCKLWIWTHLPKKSLMENFFFCAFITRIPPLCQMTTNTFSKKAFKNFCVGPKNSLKLNCNLVASLPVGNYMLKINNRNTRTKVWNMIKVNNKATKTTPMASCWWLYC